VEHTDDPDVLETTSHLLDRQAPLTDSKGRLVVGIPETVQVAKGMIDAAKGKKT